MSKNAEKHLTYVEWIRVGLLIVDALQENSPNRFLIAISSIEEGSKARIIADGLSFNEVKVIAKIIHDLLGTIIGKDKK